MLPRHRSDPGSGSGQSRYPGTFLLAFRHAVTGMNWQIRRWLSDAVECVDAAGREQVIGLENLFRRARRAERSNWPELITDFLKTGQLAPVDNPPQELAAVADQLLVRLGPPMSTRGEGPLVWQKQIEGTPLVVSLVVDFPQSMFYVTAEMVEQSGKPGDDWLAQAVENLRKKTPAESFTLVHEESGLRQSSVGDAYDSSRVFLLPELVPEGRQHGYLVALPGRDELMVLPVSSASLPFLPLLKMVAGKNHKTAPYPISNEVFWIKDGVWQMFAIDMENNRASVQPPAEFLPILRELLPEGLDEGANEEPEPEA